MTSLLNNEIADESLAPRTNSPIVNLKKIKKVRRAAPSHSLRSSVASPTKQKSESFWISGNPEIANMQTPGSSSTSSDSNVAEEAPATLSAYLGSTPATSLSEVPRKNNSRSSMAERVAEVGVQENVVSDIIGKLTISAIRNLNNFLGESPFYQPETDRVYWVDILKGTLNYWHRPTGQMGRWDLKQKIGCAVPVHNNPNIFLIGTTKGPALFDIRRETWVHTYNNPEHNLINNRWNDGKCGPDGVLWIGSMNGFNTDKSLQDGLREGGLYYLDGLIDRPALKKRLDYVGISNGLAWSKSGLFMYYIDSSSQRVSEYHYISNETKTRVGTHYPGISIHLSRPDLITIDKARGVPDGCAMDRDDNLWVALWGGYAIEQFSTVDGRLLNHIPLPDKYITSLAWFGPNLDRLFVTSAISDSLVTILDQILTPNKNDSSNSDSKAHKVPQVPQVPQVPGPQGPQVPQIEGGRVYVIDFSKTNIRGLAVNGFEMAKFRG